MKIIPNYFSINNNLNVNNQKQTSFGKNFTIPDDIAKGPGVENITPQFQVKAPIAYSHIEDIKLPNNLTAHYYKLANGQKVIIVPKKGATIVKTYVNTGSLNEPDHLRGISHYIEHNLFNGSEALGDKVFFDEVNKMGASTNASTNFSLTDYYISSQRLEDTDFERQIKLHAGMVQTPKFLQEKLDKEKKIVDSEINMALSDEYSRAATITIKNLFNIKSKAPDLVAGSTDNIDALTRDDVVNYFNNNYFPANMVTVITGETTPEEAMPLIAKYFNSTKSPQSNRHHEPMTPTNRPVRQDLISTKNEGAAEVLIGFAGPENNNSKDKVHIEAIGLLFNGLIKSRVKDIEKKHSTKIYYNIERLGSRPTDKTALMLDSYLPEKNVEPMLKDFYRAIHSLSVTPPTPEEFEAIKTKLKFADSKAFQSSKALNSYIGIDFLNGDTHFTANYNTILDNMTYQDFINTAKKYYDLNKVALTVVHPKGTTRESIINNYNKTKETGNIAFTGRTHKTPIDTNKITEYKTLNNFNVSLQDEDTDVVNYHINIGTNKHICQNIVAAEVLNDMLEHCGSQQRSWENIAAIEDNNAISSGIGAGTKGIGISADFPVEKAYTALSLFREKVLYPKFTPELFTQAVQRCIDKYSTIEPNAYEKYGKEMFKNTPQEMTAEERLEKLSKLQYNDVINLFNQIMTQGQGQVSVTGPFSKHPELKQEIFNNLAYYHTVRPKDITLENVYTPVEKSKVYTTETNKNQATILEGFKYQQNRNVKDSVCIELLEYILGGSPSSRLFSDLREKRQLAYTVSSFSQNNGDTGIMTLQIQTTTDNKETGEKTPDNIKKSIDGFRENIKKISTEKVTSEELETAKKALKNEMLAATEKSINKNGILFDSGKNPYGINYFNKKFETIDSITAEDILNTAKNIFSQKPIYSIAGTKEAIDANKEFLQNLGELG